MGAAALGLLFLLEPAYFVSLEPASPLEHRRPPEQTFLTFPEWSLVFGPAEYAAYLRDRRPSEFPYVGEVGQFWEGYRAVWQRTRGVYPFNLGYHVMVMVIGTSTTFEYGVKAAYETLIGRLSEMTRTHGLTAEDRLAADAARRYVDFIRIWPWYEYDFVSELRRLWAETGWRGPDQIRKWERKYALTAELGSKAAYGWIIKRLTKIAYDEPISLTAILLDRLPDAARARLPKLQVLRTLPDGSVLATVPRYAAFDAHASELARSGVRFLEVAGNRGDILVAVLAPAAWSPSSAFPAGRVVLVQPLLTRPEVQRVVVAVPVGGLSETLRSFDGPGFELEHVYDY